MVIDYCRGVSGSWTGLNALNGSFLPCHRVNFQTVNIASSVAILVPTKKYDTVLVLAASVILARARNVPFLDGRLPR